MAKKELVIDECLVNDGWEGSMLKHMNILSSAWMIQETMRMLYAKSVIDSKESNSVLDIGCSDGVFMHVYARMARSPSTRMIKYVGCDMRQSALDKLEETKYELYSKAQAEKIFTTNVNYLKADQVKKLLKEHGKFDCVIAMEVIEHFPREYAQTFLSHIKRSLNEGGVMILSTPIHHKEEAMYYPDSHCHEFMYNELLNLLEDNFFKVTVVGNHVKANDLKSYLAKNEPEEYEVTKRLIAKTKQGGFVNSLMAMLHPEAATSAIFVCEV